MTLTNRFDFLRTVLLADTTTCVATGFLMAAGSSTIASITQIPEDLLMAAGLSLFPIAAFIAFVATRDRIPARGVWLVILGNVGWVLGSLLLLFEGAVHPNGLGTAFIVVQAIAVAVLAECEFIGVRKTQRAVA